MVGLRQCSSGDARTQQTLAREVTRIDDSSARRSGAYSLLPVGSVVIVGARRWLVQPVPEPEKLIDHYADAQERQHYDDRGRHIYILPRFLGSLEQCWRYWAAGTQEGYFRPPKRGHVSLTVRILQRPARV